MVGAHAGAAFADGLHELGLAPPHAGLLRALAQRPGISQQELATELGVVPSRLVALLDALEEKDLVERRAREEDRRSHALHLTKDGTAMLPRIGQVAMARSAQLLAPLSPDERTQLAALLQRIAEGHGLSVHPGLQKKE